MSLKKFFPHTEHWKIFIFNQLDTLGVYNSTVTVVFIISDEYLFFLIIFGKNKNLDQEFEQVTMADVSLV